MFDKGDEMKNVFLITIICCVIGLVSGCSEKKLTEPIEQSDPSAPVKELDEKSFEAAISNGVVLVDFWAPWCGPCRMQGPIVEKIAKEVQDFANVAKLNVDRSPKVARRFDIRGIPTLIIFKDGKPTKRFVGLTKSQDLLSAIEAAR
jgi:thioredoxin 1